MQFRLLKIWRDHVLNGVENRHELIPEILRMIPLFVQVGATEEAEKMYLHLLSVSMGPTWYKEEQLGIMTEVLGNVEGGATHLPRIGELLEIASGELTFQNFVRAEKSKFVGVIANKQRLASAIKYFQRQCCGDYDALQTEACSGTIDRIGPFRGNRFPGNGIDDQLAVLSLVASSPEIPCLLRWSLLEIFYCGDDVYAPRFAKAFADITNESESISILIKRIGILTFAETATEDQVTFAREFLNKIKPELRCHFKNLDLLLSTVDSESPVQNNDPDIASDDDDDDDDDEFLHFPGTIGTQGAIEKSKKLLEQAEAERKLGNNKAAKNTIVKYLSVLQDGDWGIWDDMGPVANRALEILTESEESATAVIRYLAPLIDTEDYAATWSPAQYLLKIIGRLLTTEEEDQLTNVVIDHIELVLGDRHVQVLQSSLDDVKQQKLSGAEMIFDFVVWLCDHPHELRRGRAAALLICIMEHSPELMEYAVTRAFSMHTGQGPDILCGIIDCESNRNPVDLWDKVHCTIKNENSIKDLRHVSRATILKRIATRANNAGSETAQSIADQFHFSGSNHEKREAAVELPAWAAPFSKEWEVISKFGSMDSIEKWESELTDLCEPLRIDQAHELEKLVSESFRDPVNAPFDRWESKLRYSLNVALWSCANESTANKIESTLRIYNPSYPERTVQPRRKNKVELVLVSIESNDYSNLLFNDSLLHLSYHDSVMNRNKDGGYYLEITCLIKPRSATAFAKKTQPQMFYSSELPCPESVSYPFETCANLVPQTVFLGEFTPAVPLPSFVSFIKLEEKYFVRNNWRYGRSSSIANFGRPMSEGCSLSVPRAAVNVPSEFQLVWLIRLNGDFVGILDENNENVSL